MSQTRRGPLPPTYFALALVLMAGMHVALPGARLVTGPWRLAGLVPIVAGAALNLVADRAFKDRATTVKPFETSSALITDGAFRWTRNPMYLGMVLALAGLAVLAGTLSPWVVVAAFGLAMEVAFVRPEERALEATFGDAFRAYRARTRRWL
jgi:protein-S-isoprenylcysteine O-methyltransferase Ste14